MRALLVFTFLISACVDETISGYTNSDETYRLVQIDGIPFTSKATIAFPEKGSARGTAPCNTWSATQTAPYPWVEFGPTLATRRSCPEMVAETRFFSKLSTMSLAEVKGDTLILSNDTDHEMVFQIAH